MAPGVEDSSEDSFQANQSGDKERKFRVDPPGDDPDNSSSLSDEGSDLKMCLLKDLGLGVSFSTDDVKNDLVNWSLPTAMEVRKLAASILETMLRDAIKKIVAFGCSEEFVNKVVLRRCPDYGLEDLVQTVVNNTLLFLKDANEFDLSRAHYFDDLEKMADHMVWELQCILRRSRAFLSIGDAYWLLILGDMNIKGVCLLIDNLLSETPPGPKFDYSVSQTCEVAKPEKSTVEIKSEKSTVSSKREQKPRQKGRNSRSRNQALKTTETASANITKTPLLNKTATQSETKPNPLNTCSQGKTEIKLFGEITKTPQVIMETPQETQEITETPQETTETPQEITETPQEITETPQETRETALGSEKDAALMMLTCRERALREKVRAWNEWAREKVMQAAKRLGKDKAELRELREERESFERVREAIRDATEKNMLETESSIRRAGAQIERVRVAGRMLEGESGRLMRERDVARAAAEEAEERVQEGARREREREERGREGEREKEVIREEVAAEKRRGEKLHKEAELVLERRNRLQARLKQDQNAKDKLLEEANSVRNERIEAEASTKKENQTIQANVEASKKKYNDDVQKLEKEISELRLKNDASIIAAIRQRVKKLSPEEAQLRDLSRRAITKLDDGAAEIKRDRECAICLSEDRTVIFLPCAHQILCKECNEIHEMQGMKDCPSCRTVIQERICVRYASERR